MLTTIRPARSADRWSALTHPGADSRAAPRGRPGAPVELFELADASGDGQEPSGVRGHAAGPQRGGSAAPPGTRAPGRLLSMMLYSFAGAMRCQDYFGQGSWSWLRLHENGGKRHDLAAQHRAAAVLDAYVEAAGLDELKAALFQAIGHRLTGRAISTGGWCWRRSCSARAAAGLLPSTCCCGRRAAALDVLPPSACCRPSTCCRTFRATGISSCPSFASQLASAAGASRPHGRVVVGRVAAYVDKEGRRLKARDLGHPIGRGVEHVLVGSPHGRLGLATGGRGAGRRHRSLPSRPWVSVPWQIPRPSIASASRTRGGRWRRSHGSGCFVVYGFRSFSGGAARELGDRLREEAEQAQSKDHAAAPAGERGFARRAPLLKAGRGRRRGSWRAR